jgi:hypothetical protein
MKQALPLMTLALFVSSLAQPLLAQDKLDTKPTEQKAKSTSSDEELLKDLVPDIPLGESGEDSSDGNSGLDELDKTIRAMRQVGKRIDDGDTSDETRELQVGILDDIDALIEKLKTQPPPQPQNPNQKPPQDQSQNDQQKPQQNGTKPESQTQPRPSAGKQPSGKQPTGSGAGQKQENKQAGESTEDNLKQARARATALARRRALINEVWGHLPPAMRERLLNVGSENLLPQYEELIRRYYESLADSPETKKR